MSDNAMAFKEGLLDLISIREMESQDVNFIVDSFISCLTKYHKTILKGYSPKYSRQLLERIILTALQKPNYSTFICCNKDDSQDIWAYIIGDSNSQHVFFNYTKYVRREFGLQKLFLLPLLLEKNQPFTVNWPTKEALLAIEKYPNDVMIQNKFLWDML